MHLILVLVFCAVLVILYKGILEGAAVGEKIEDAFNTGKVTLENWKVGIHELFIEHVHPSFRKATYFAIAFIMFAFAHACYLFFTESVPVEKMALAFFILLIPLIVGIGALVWELLKSPYQFSVFSIGSTTSLVFFLHSFVYLWIGAYLESWQLAVTGAFFMICAEEILFAFLVIAAELVALGIEASEGGLSYLLRFATSLIVNGKKALAEFMGIHVDYAPEEKIRALPGNIRRRIRASVYPVFAVTIVAAALQIIPALAVMGVMTLVGVVIYFTWGYLESVGIETLARRQRSALLIEKIIIGGLTLAIIVMIIPQSREIVLELVNTVQGFILFTLTHITRFLKNHPVVILVGISTAVMSWTFRSAIGEKIFGSKIGKFMASIAALACFGCIIAGVYLQLREPADNTAKGVATATIKHLVPSASATKDGTAKIEWSSFLTKEVWSARIERRGIRETGFSSLATLQPGALSYEDRNVVRGETYFYRVVFIDPVKGEVLTTSESEVKVPLLVAMVRKEPSPRPVVVQPVGESACADGSCGKNPALQRLHCRRNPNAPGCS